jgi:hypothetical protein
VQTGHLTSKAIYRITQPKLTRVGLCYQIV